MSLPRPKVTAPTPAAPEPVTGAEELRLGAPQEAAGGRGSIGRLRLRTSSTAKSA